MIRPLGMGRTLVTVALVAVSVLLGAVAPAAADQTDKRLNRLFAALKTTKDEAKADRLTGFIWRIWRQTRNDAASIAMSRGITALSLRQYGKALAAFDTVVRIAPRYAEGWNKRATVYYLMDKYDASVRDIARTLKLEPRHFGAMSGLGLIYLRLGRDKAALGAFSRALRINPHLRNARREVRQLRKELGGEPI